MPLRIEYRGNIISGRQHVERHNLFTGRLSAKPANGYYTTTSPVLEAYDENNKDRHCSQMSQCSGVMWRLIECKLASSYGSGLYSQTWETRCPFASELDGTDAGKFCERDWWENLYSEVPEHTHESSS